MKTLLISAAGAGLFAVVLFTQTSRHPGHIASGSIPTNSPPGIYQAKPYTGIVVVPGSIDNGLVQKMQTFGNNCTIRSLRPDIQLEPKK